MSSEKTSSLLPGLPVVRMALGLTQAALAESVGVSGFTVSTWESGGRDARGVHIKALASTMACSTDDLYGEPSAKRLAEIRAAYHQREADRAREEARAAS